MRACGSGGVVLSSPLHQSKSYFEIKIQQEGHWSVGVCTLDTDLNKTRGGLDQYSWCLNAENLVMNDGKVVYDLNEINQNSEENQEVNSNEIETQQLLPVENQNKTIPNCFVPLPSSNSHIITTPLPKEGDIIGITYDHVELNFYVNGKNMNIPTLIKLNNSNNSNRNSNKNFNNEFYPCLFVDDGAILDVILDNFNYQIPAGFEKILVEQTLL